MKQRILLLFAVALTTFFVQSQTQGVAFTTVGKGVATPFVTDYHCLGINASALGWGTGYADKRFTMGSSEFGFGIYSDNLTADKLKNLTKTLLNQARNNLYAPWLAITGFTVMALMLSLLIFIGEAVRDAFDPRKTF